MEVSITQRRFLKERSCGHLCNDFRGFIPQVELFKRTFFLHGLVSMISRYLLSA